MKLVNHWFWSAFSEHRSIYYRVMLAATLVNFMSIGSSIFIMVVYDRVVPNSAIGRWLKDVKQYEIIMKDRNK